MNKENTKWFSQTLLTYKDKHYSTEGYMRISYSSNTEDYKFYNPPMLNISISNQHQKAYNLNIQNAEDLLESFTEALKQLNGDDIVIEKKYNKTTKIVFKFAMTSSTNERVVVIEIISSETDAVKIIVPLKPIFQSFLRRLKYFVEHYDKLCMSLFNQTLNGDVRDIIMQIPRLIKGISSQIISEIPPENEILDSPAPIDDVNIENTMSDINDLDKYLGDDMKNIKIPEIDKNKIDKAAPVVEIESKLIDKVLKGDLNNLESKLTSFAMAGIPIMELSKDLEKSIGFDLFHDIKKDDRTSIYYISTMFYQFLTKNYTINNGAIPSGTPPLKFVSKPTENHVEFAKDVLMIMSYIRTVSRRLEGKLSDAYENKSMMYIFIRLFMDPFCYSYLQSLSRTELLGSVKNRFEYFNQNDFFNKYTKLLEEYNCASISVQDVMSLVEETADKLIETPSIDILHSKLYETDNVKLVAKNMFNLEQIINEFVPLEVNEKLGSDFTNKEVLSKLKEMHNISDEIMNFYLGKQKITKTSMGKKITPLVRLVNKFKQDIPEQYRNEVLESINDLSYDTFDFTKAPWPLDEFDERIIKAFYIWNPTNDEKMKSNFEYFATLVEDEVMTKDSILISIKSSGSDEWNAVENMI